MWMLKALRIVLLLLSAVYGVSYCLRWAPAQPICVAASAPEAFHARGQQQETGRVAIPRPAAPKSRPAALLKSPPAPEAAPGPGTQGEPLAPIQVASQSAMLASSAPGNWLNGRRLFENGWRAEDGLGAPGFNGRSCATCHQDPVSGGAGNIEFNVLRTATAIGYVPSEEPGDQLVRMRELRSGIQERIVVFRQEVASGQFNIPGTSREELEQAATICADLALGTQTPSLFGSGLIDAIPDAEILSRADPDDLDGDGIRGVAGQALVNGKPVVGRFGWKANVPRLLDFVCLALGGENGVTTPDQGRGFGLTKDDDLAADPELEQTELDDLTHFVANLMPDTEHYGAKPSGELLFTQVGCADCHTPSLRTDRGMAVPLYSDLLLHELRERPKPLAFLDQNDLATDESPGFRTPPLWGVAKTAPYMHSGCAETLRDAILAHGLEGQRSRDSFERLRNQDQSELIAFLETL